MLTLTIAVRTLLKRKGRMALIAVLVGFGTFLIVFGGIFSSSVARESRDAIIGNFTGDFIVYSDRAKSLPSPFAFSTPLPVIKNPEKLSAVIRSLEDLESFAFYSQNYGLIQVERDGRKFDLPFIFYAVAPAPYRDVFSNLDIKEGSYFSLPENGPASSAMEPGILISEYQNAQYLKNYGVTLKAGEPVTLLGITEGGVNTARSSLQGIFSPRRYKSVFDYINYMDDGTYAKLYNFSGVTGLPEGFDAALSAAGTDEADIFALADDDAFGKIDVETLTAETLSGFTMAAVRMNDRDKAAKAAADIMASPGLGVKVASWKEASGFYAQISEALQGFIFLATGLIFLVVTLIFMNTLIINVVERTAEIGTMRAIGADKSFVRGVFLAETLVLNVSAALLAMAVSAALLAVTSRTGIPLPDTISQFLIGGGSLNMEFEVVPFLAALAVVITVSILATLYPVSVATSITPLKAMNDK